MKKIFLLLSFFFFATLSFSQKDSTVTKKDRKRNVLLQTSMGDIIIRLSDSTPLHRDNFLKLVKVGFYDSILFHRVIKDFMIQGGDPTTKNAKADGPRYTIPAEFRKSLFHKKGVIAAARNNNPEKASSGSQFYITQGKIFTDAGLDSLEKGKMFKDDGLNSLKNVTLEKKIPEEYRAAYKTIGGTPHLDFDYTVYGEVVKGIETVDKIAAVPTSRDRPVTDVRIIKATLIKRKKYKN